MARAGHRIARVVTEMNSLTLMKQAAGAGIGATILSWPSVEADVAQGKVAAIEIARPAITRVAAMCMLAHARVSRATECVLSEATRAVRETVRRAPWRGVRFIGPE